MVFWEFFVLCTFQTVFYWRLYVVSLKNSSSYYLTIERRMGGFQKTSENKYLSEIEDSTKNGRYINQFLNFFVLRITINFNSDICSKFTSKYCNKKIAPFQRKISLFSCTWSVSEMFAILIKTLVGENSISKIEEGIIYPLKYEWITVIFHHLWAVPRTSK